MPSMRRCRRSASSCEIAARGRASRSGRSCSTCRSRSPRAGAPTTRPRSSACSSCSASRTAGPRRCARCSGCGRRRSCPRFTGETVVELQVPCTYDFEVTAAKYLAGARRRRGAARAAVQRHRLLRGRGRAAADGDDRLGPRGRVPAAGRGVARDDGHLLPGQRLAAARTARRSTGCTPTARSTRSRAGSTPLDALLLDGAGGAVGVDELQPDRGRRAVRGLRAVALPPVGDQEPAALDVRRRLPEAHSDGASGRPVP